MKKLFKLFLAFAKIGAVTFGGGYAMLPILQRDIVKKHGWATDEELMDYFAIGQCTPGIIAVNTATFVGYNEGGFWGALFATLGVAAPSVLIITIISAFITNYADIQAVAHAFAGIRACVCALILNAVLKLKSSALKDKWTYIIFGIVFILSFFLNVSSALLVVLAGAAGLAVKRCIAREEK